MGAGGGWWGVGAKREGKERGKRRGGRVGSVRRAWGARGAAKVVLERYKAELYLSKMSARRRRAKFFGLFLMAPNITPPPFVCAVSA